MKRYFYILILVIISMTLFQDAFANNNILNIYNWSGYLPAKVLTLFEKETGIRVNYSVFDSNQTLYTKLKADSNSDYDLIVPSSYFVERMRKEGMLQKIDRSKLSNFKFLDQKLLNQSYDPQNEYSIPYMWGTVGIVANRKYYPKGTIKNWKDLWRSQYKNKVSFSDDMRDVFAIGMRVKGYSINDRNPQHIVHAYAELKKILVNVRSFESGGSQQMYVNEDCNLGVLENGDAYLVIQENPNFYFINPKDGPIVWVDSMAIPKNAKHLNNVYKFINFVLRPDVAKMISQGVGYSTPNKAALRLMSQSVRDNHVINPTKEELKNYEVEGYLGVEANRLYLKYWQLLKLGA